MAKFKVFFYRANTLKKAQSLNITGWVRNNEDDTVELRAFGDEKNIRALIAWLHQGPPTATVTHVNWTEIPEEKHDAFVILR